jgi:hypothetical protein
MARGILGTIGLAATLVFAIPVGLLGLNFLVDGRYLLGAGFLGVAALMVILQEYVTTPTDLPGKAAEKAVGAVVEMPEDDDKGEGG